MTDLVPADPWARLRALTPARIGRGRTGGSLPSIAVLEFQLAHARARDAVLDAMDVAAVVAALDNPGTVVVASQAGERARYLQRPDLGRRLDPAAAGRLVAGAWDLAFVVADGLSARAAERHAAPLIYSFLALAPDLKVAPPVVALQARVALGDEVGERLGVPLVAVLIGERPGLSAADSLGAYLTFAPHPGRRDAERLCLSNIRTPDGTPPEAAAAALVELVRTALREGRTGVTLPSARPGPAMTLEA